MNKRRILIVTNRVPYPLNDGGALAMDAMILGYKAEGWEVLLFSMNTSRHYVDPSIVRRRYRDIHTELYDIDTRVKALPLLWNFLFSGRPNHAARFYDKGFEARLTGLVRSFQPAIIQLESIFLAGYMPSIHSVTDAPLVIRLHNVEYQIWERLTSKTGNPLRRFYLKDLAKRIRKFEAGAWESADLLLPITDVDRDIIKAAGITTEMVTVPFGVAIFDTSAESPVDEWIGYHLGAMDWMPNAEGIRWFLKEVWPGLHAKLPGFRFYFAGRNMPESFLHNNIEGVFCEGEVPDAADFIKDKKILIVPLRSGGGVRVKILEAMAAGKLVISTTVGMQGIPAVAGTHYLPANTSEEFIELISWALNNKSNAGEIAAAGAKLIEEYYDQKRIMAALAERLEGLMSV